MGRMRLERPKILVVITGHHEPLARRFVPVTARTCIEHRGIRYGVSLRTSFRPDRLLILSQILRFCKFVSYASFKIS